MQAMPGATVEDPRFPLRFAGDDRVATALRPTAVRGHLALHARALACVLGPERVYGSGIQSPDRLYECRTGPDPGRSRITHLWL